MIDKYLKMVCFILKNVLDRHTEYATIESASGSYWYRYT